MIESTRFLLHPSSMAMALTNIGKESPPSCIYWTTLRVAPIIVTLTELETIYDGFIQIHKLEVRITGSIN